MTTITKEQITPDFILSLYKKHGMFAAPFEIDPRRGVCCGMGIICYDLGITINPGHTTLREQLEKFLDTDFINWFEGGFDHGICNNHSFKPYNEVWQLGFDCGLKAREMLPPDPKV